MDSGIVPKRLRVYTDNILIGHLYQFRNEYSSCNIAPAMVYFLSHSKEPMLLPCPGKYHRYSANDKPFMVVSIDQAVVDENIRVFILFNEKLWYIKFIDIRTFDFSFKIVSMKCDASDGK